MPTRTTPAPNRGGNRSRFDLVDRILDGRLAIVLRDYKAQGLTFDQMATAFAARGIEVSRETLRRWSRDLDAS